MFVDTELLLNQNEELKEMNDGKRADHTNTQAL